MAPPAPQWADLPQEILEIIATKIPTLSGQVRFRGVCRSWRSASKSAKLPPLLPLLTQPTSDEGNNGTAVSFFSPSTGRAHTVHLRETRRRAICGSSHGFLVLIDRKLDSLLYNPLTGTKIPLPPSDRTFLRALGLNRSQIMKTVNLYRVPDLFQCYAFLASYPELPQECIIAFATFGGVDAFTNQRFVYCRLGDSKWTPVNVKCRGNRFGSLAYHRGKFYCCDLDANVCVWDVGWDPKRTLRVIPALRKHNFSYLTLVDDNLLMVTEHKGLFELSKLNKNSEGNLSWERIQGIGEYKVFLNRYQPSTVVVTDASGCRGNTIYFQPNLFLDQIWEFDIDTGRDKGLQELPYQTTNRSLVKRCIWFTPKFL